jgi:hypothetical protein
LRDFTAFSARADPDVIMTVLREYYEALELSLPVMKLR